VIAAMYLDCGSDPKKVYKLLGAVPDAAKKVPPQASTLAWQHPAATPWWTMTLTMLLYHSRVYVFALVLDGRGAL